MCNNTRSKLVGFNVVNKDGSIIRKFRSKTKREIMETIIKCYGMECNVRDFHRTFIDVDKLVLVYKEVFVNPHNPNSFHARKEKRTRLMVKK